MGHGMGMSLIGVAAGYWILERSAAQKGHVKNLGQFLAWVVIVASLVGILCPLWGFATRNPMCPVGKRSWGGCPLSRLRERMSPPSSAPADAE